MHLADAFIQKEEQKQLIKCIYNKLNHIHNTNAVHLFHKCYSDLNACKILIFCYSLKTFISITLFFF